MKKKIILLMIIFILFVSCNKKNKIDENTNIELKKDTDLQAEELKKTDSYGVINVNRLRFRLEPYLNSKTLRFLDKGIIVSIVKKDAKRVKVGEMEDYWYQIEYDGINGWVFGYFLDIYNSYENAQNQAKQYIQSGPDEIKNDNSVVYDDDINKSLFFLSNGKIIQVIDGKGGIAKKLKILSDLNVIYYFFADNPNQIYYIAKPQGSTNDNGNLYVYDLEKEKSLLLLNDIYSASYNEEEKTNMLLLKNKKIDNSKYWVILISKMNNISNPKEIASIKQKRAVENIDNDLFIKTLQRELGNVPSLKIEPKGRYIYFKPPEENLTYLVSTKNGNFIQIENDDNSVFEIDSYRNINVNSQEGSDGLAMYSIVLKDKFSGLEKEIISSKFYPINFIVSPKKNLVAISMIDINKKDSDYYPSSIYVLSLITYSLMAISTEGKSYQPRWITNFLK